MLLAGFVAALRYSGKDEGAGLISAPQAYRACNCAEPLGLPSTSAQPGFFLICVRICYEVEAMELFSSGLLCDEDVVSAWGQAGVV